MRTPYQSLFVQPPVNEAHERLRANADYSKYFTGRNELLVTCLRDMSTDLVTLARELAAQVNTLVERAEDLGPVLFQQESMALRLEIAAFLYACRVPQRPILKPLFDRTKDISTWHVRPMWGSPSWAAFARLEASHIAVHGKQAPYVIQDLFLRKVRKPASPAVFAAANHRCVRCGKGDALQVDHIVPISKGGLNYGLNFQALCRRCNLQKHDETWWPGMEPKP